MGQIADEFKDDIPEGEMMDLFEAVRTLKRGSGWGRIELIYKMDLTDIDITIKRKPRKQKPV